MSIYNVMPARGASRRNLVVTARACRTDEGQLPVGVHGDDEHGMKPSDSPDHAGVDVVFLRTILQLLVLVTVAVGAIGVNIAIHSPPQERQLTSVVSLCIDEYQRFHPWELLYWPRTSGGPHRLAIFGC